MNRTPRTSISIPDASAVHCKAMCMFPCMQTVGEKAGT